MSSTFRRKKEDFECEQCGVKVVGDGYTNHCPECLISKHVDIFPGDRAERCGGLMPAVGWELDHGATVIVHRCSRCGLEKKNKAAANDKLEALLAA